jgi:hypothetical protein
MWDCFFIRELVLLLATCRETLDSSIKIRLSLDKLVEVNILDRKHIIDPKNSPEPLLDPFHKVYSLIFVPQLIEQNKDQSISMVVGLIEYKGLFKVVE